MAAVPSALAAQRGAADATVAAYARVVASAFDVPLGEATLLLEEGIRPEELPVVLSLGQQSGLSPSVILSRRHRGGQQTAWIQVAQQVNLDASAFHIEIAENEMDERARGATEPFRATPRTGWAALSLTDDQIVILTNVRVLSRGLDVPKRQVLEARERAGSWPGSIPFLLGVP